MKSKGNVVRQRLIAAVSRYARSTRKQVTVKHEDIKGLMPAMTMPYAVKDQHLLDGLAAGDLIDATLVVVSNDAYLTAIRKVGQAPLDKPPADAPMPARFRARQ